MDADAIVDRALAEDVGSGDVTTRATVPEGARARARITQKQPGVVFGLDVAETVFRRLDPAARVTRLAEEGRWREGGPVLNIEAAAGAMLTAERTALNFLQRLSGVATQAARYVSAIEGTGARILDTRKTTPGLRALEKAAVAAGGATNHRAGLYDAVLIKENHAAMAGGVVARVGGGCALPPGGWRAASRPRWRRPAPPRRRCRSRSSAATWPRSTRRCAPAPRGFCSTT
jgi:nicotinate-nucleotide pyrophosphorylase (carboxylating)